MTTTRTGDGKGKRFAAAAIVLLSFTAAGCDKFKSKQLIREGNAYFKEQLYEDALKKYEQAQALDPAEVRLDKFVAMGNMALYNPGSTHPKDLAALAKSIEHFKKYLAARPDDDRECRVLQHPGADARHRVRAAGQRRSHPHDLPRSDQRLRCEVFAPVIARPCCCSRR